MALPESAYQVRLMVALMQAGGARWVGLGRRRVEVMSWT